MPIPCVQADRYPITPLAVMAIVRPPASRAPPMRGGVNATGQSANDRNAGAGQTTGQTVRLILAIVRRVPCAHDRDCHRVHGLDVSTV